MSAFPSSPAFSYPVTARLVFETRIFTGKNGTEQRIQISNGKASWDLSFPQLSITNRDILLGYFEDRKGSALQFDFTFLGTTYTGCYFDADRFSAVETAPQSSAVSLRICKVTRTAEAGTLATDFPVLSTSARLQRPYTHERAFDTVAVNTEGGRSAYSKRTADLRTWSAGGPVLTTTEAQAIWTMFSLAGGRYRTFAFTDPDSATRFTNCRFGLDAIEWRMLDAGLNSLQVTVQECVP